MRLLLCGVLLSALTLGPAAARADVRLTFGSGEVSVAAQNATLSQILTEWARIGHVKIVNGERVAGPPLTLELSHTPEAQALDILLRSVAGFVLVARPGTSTTQSKYDRILILPTSAARPVATPASAPAFQQPRPGPVMARPAEQDGDPNGAGPQPPPQRPGFTPFPQTPQPQPGQPRAPESAAPPPASPGPATFGGGAAGSRTPGVITPPPAPITQPAPNSSTPQ